MSKLHQKPTLQSHPQLEYQDPVSQQHFNNPQNITIRTTQNKIQRISNVKIVDAIKILDSTLLDSQEDSTQNVEINNNQEKVHSNISHPSQFNIRKSIKRQNIIKSGEDHSLINGEGGQSSISHAQGGGVIKTMQTSTPNTLQQLLMKRKSVITAQDTIGSGSGGPMQNSSYKQQVSMVSLISQKIKEIAIDENTKYLQPKQREMVSILCKVAAKRTQAELDSLVPMIQAIQFFKEREISRENCVHIAETMQYEFISDGSMVFRQGDQGDKFYIIIDGEVSVKIFNKVYDAKKKDLNAINITIKHLLEDKQEIEEELEEITQALSEVPQTIANDIKEIDGRIKETIFLADQCLTELDTIPEFIELQKMSSGKSFGEKALIMNSLRAANVCCIKNSHFAVMNKNDYDKVLRKIELKNQNKIICFLKEIPYLKLWTRKMLLNFSYYLSIKQYPMGHVIFKEGEDCDSIAIIKQGNFELRKKIPNQINDSKSLLKLVTGLLAIPEQQTDLNPSDKSVNQAKNSLAAIKIRSSIQDRISKVHSDNTMHTVSLAMLGQGQLFGDIDFVFQRCYTYQLKVIENNSQLYIVKSKDFEKVIKMHKETWRMVEKSAIQRNHSLLEKFTQQFTLRWDQNQEVKNIIHQHSVSKNGDQSLEKQFQKIAKESYESPQKVYSAKKNNGVQSNDERQSAMRDGTSSKGEIKSILIRNNQSATQFQTRHNQSQFNKKDVEIQDQSAQNSSRSVVKNVSHLRQIQSQGGLGKQQEDANLLAQIFHQGILLRNKEMPRIQRLEDRKVRKLFQLNLNGGQSGRNSQHFQTPTLDSLTTRKLAQMQKALDQESYFQMHDGGETPRMIGSGQSLNAYKSNGQLQTESPSMTRFRFSRNSQVGKAYSDGLFLNSQETQMKRNSTSPQSHPYSSGPSVFIPSNVMYNNVNHRITDFKVRRPQMHVASTFKTPQSRASSQMDQRSSQSPPPVYASYNQNLKQQPSGGNTKPPLKLKSYI